MRSGNEYGRVADNLRIWALAPDLLSHHPGESWDLTPSEVRSYKSSDASARHGADGDHSAHEHCALEVKMERTLPIPRRVHSRLSVLPRAHPMFTSWCPSASVQRPNAELLRGVSTTLQRVRSSRQAFWTVDGPSGNYLCGCERVQPLAFCVTGGSALLLQLLPGKPDFFPKREKGFWTQPITLCQSASWVAVAGYNCTMTIGF